MGHLFILHLECRMSCCPHVDQISRILPASNKTMSRLALSSLSYTKSTTSYIRAVETIERVPKLSQDIHCYPKFVKFILPDQRLYSVMDMSIYAHI